MTTLNHAAFARGDSLSFKVANCLSDVETAWKLVYERYSASGFIASNPFEIHTSVQALHTNTCVILGQCNGRVTSTMTMVANESKGLSLDYVYPYELKELRRARRKLLEVGLLVGNCQGSAGRDIAALFELMKWGVYYALHLDISDIVIGVHPHHAKFYTRCFGFEQFGPETVYPLVKNKPVVPLRLRVNEQLAHKVLPRGLRHARDNPIDRDAFLRRYAFCDQGLSGSRIERFVGSAETGDGGYYGRKRGTADWRLPLDRLAPQPAA